MCIGKRIPHDLLKVPEGHISIERNGFYLMNSRRNEAVRGGGAVLSHFSALPQGVPPKFAARKARSFCSASLAAGSSYSTQRPRERMPGFNSTTSKAWFLVTGTAGEPLAERMSPALTS